MSKRMYKPQNDTLAIPDGDGTLPINQPIAVYYRQSTHAQIGNISTTLQTVDMVEYLKQRGWQDKDILMIDMDGGISGSTKIDERPGMKMLFDLITQGKIRAVACQDEDRLFRDVTQIQVNIFIEACRANNVFVLTPSMVYGFANEQLGAFHARQFRFKSEMAAEYINSVIRGKLHRAKRRLLTDGLWAGSPMPPGFMVDTRKTLPDGSRNDAWRRFVPFEPYAEVVREYFRLFLSNGGNVRVTELHIHKHGPYYPDPAECLPPQGFKATYQLHRYGNGYCPGRTGLLALLTNVTYIGHWTLNKAVIRWNNHLCIVPHDTFLKAFNYLSPVTMDGLPNPDYRPIREHTRPSLDSKRPVERPLCSGMIVSKLNDRWRNASAHWVKPLNCYRYMLKSGDLGDEYLWSKDAVFLDKAVTKLLVAKLRKTFGSPIWEQTLANFQVNISQEHKSILAQIAALERVMERQITSLETLANRAMIQKVQVRFEEAQTEHQRLTTVREASENELHRLEVLDALRSFCKPALENWEELTRDEKRVALHAFIRRIEATPIENNALHLLLYWRDETTDEITLLRNATVGNQWLHEEIQQLLKLVDAHATQIEIAAAFPDRTWGTIRCKVYDLRGSGALRIPKRSIYDQETYTMYQSRVASGNTTKHADSGARWTPDEVEQLLALVDNGASAIELAEAFPERRWARIWAKIRTLRGKDIQISASRKISREETFVMYSVRKQWETLDNPVMENMTIEADSAKTRP